MSKYEKQASSWVYNELRQRIEQLVYDPGQELQLVHLSQELGVSRSPVRDALLRLERDRLVDIFPQKGTRVSYLDSAVVLQERFLRQTIEEKIFDVFLDYSLSEKERLVLISNFKANLLSQETSMRTGDLISFMHYDIEFHKLFYETVGYERIYKVVQAHTGNEHRIRLLNMKVENAMAGVYEEHMNMVAAIESGGKEEARNLLAQHFGQLAGQIRGLVLVFPSYFTKKSKKILEEGNET